MNKIFLLFEGHSCNDCGVTCDDMNGVCEKWKKIENPKFGLLDHPSDKAVNGDIYFNSNTHKMMVFNHGIWVELHG